MDTDRKSKSRNRSGRLAGKRAFVTGGGSGIGAETSARFAEEGARVVTGDLVDGDVSLDVRSRDSVDAAVQEAVEILEGLDIIVCNAGKGIVGAVHEVDEATWDDGFATNLKGVYLTAKAAWPHLAESHGCILSTASVVGVWGDSGQAGYCASKAGVIALTKCMALDGATVGIRANCVCPGVTETPLVKRFFAEQEDPEATRSALVAFHPLGLGRPLDIANAFVYLASEEASWVTGHTLIVDGGMTVGMWRS
jgi:NAD(P)-dependent dehydrogenase (short-subunit alcohol dehydrogenase family)